MDIRVLVTVAPPTLPPLPSRSYRCCRQSWLESPSVFISHSPSASCQYRSKNSDRDIRDRRRQRQPGTCVAAPASEPPTDYFPVSWLGTLRLARFAVAMQSASLGLVVMRTIACPKTSMPKLG